MKTCGRCLKKLPIAAFGFSRNHQGGRNPYCKACIVEKVRMQRAESDTTITEDPLTPVERVKKAFAHGCRTREEIKLFTNLDWDVLCGVLANLAFDQQAIRVVRVGEGRAFDPVTRVA